MEKKFNVFLKIIMIILVVVTTCFNDIIPALAYDLVDVSDYPSQENVTYNGKATYLDNIVGDFSIGGKQAFCIQHSKLTPPTGTKLSSKIYNDENIRKVLYYGYDGIEPWSGLKDKQHAIVVTSLALSYFYDGDNSSPSTIKDFVAYIKSKSLPNYAVSFSKSKVSAYKSGDIQRTESITLQSGSSEFGITVNIPSLVTYVDETHGTRQTGGSVTIKGQTKFHLEASLKSRLDTFNTGAKASSYAYQPVISEPSSSSLQTLGRGYFVVDKTKTTSLSVDWLDLASLEITKTDIEGNMIDGAIFKLWNNQGYTQNLTVSNGKITVDNLLIGDYHLQEISAPQGYLLDSTIYTITLNAGDAAKKIVSNKEPLGKIELQKQRDAQVTNGMLGDSYLSDIEFGLYAKEIIYNASKTKVYYQKDQLISKQKTNVNGNITWESLPLGSYYVKELATNPSCILNPNPIDVVLSYQDMNTSLVVKSLQVQNKLASQRIQIFKEGTKEGTSGVVQGLKGAEFTFVLNSDYEKVGYDKAKKYFVGTTDQNGFLTTGLLPYGTYRVKETKTPQGYYGTSDFLVSVEKDASLYEVGYQIKKVTVNNVPFESLLKIVKLDKETGKVIQRAGATFKIKNLDTNEYVSYIDWSAFPNINISSWKTHDDGTITLNTKLKVGKYQLEEIEAPLGYLLNKEPLPFEITESSYEISDDNVTPLTIVKMSDQVVSGQITITKKGEVLDGFENGQFIYQSQGLPGAQFEIKAKEDVMDPSHDGTILYQKGDVIEILTTKENGLVTSSKLPLGEYTYQEIKTLPGYVLDNTIYSFTLSYKDQETELVELHQEIMNQRQTVSIKVSKKDEETLKYLMGAKIALIANKDIYNVRDELIVKAGTVIETLISSQEGALSFQCDLPIDLRDDQSLLEIDPSTQITGDINSLFMLKEIEPPIGYLPKFIQYYIDTKSHNTNEQQLSFEYDFYNKKKPVETLGDEPPIEKEVPIVKTEDTTIFLSYLLMGVGAILILHILFKTKDKE